MHVLVLVIAIDFLRQCLLSVAKLFKNSLNCALKQINILCKSMIYRGLFRVFFVVGKGIEPLCQD